MALNYTKGTISQMSEVTTGTSSNGNTWARMTILIDIPGYQGSTTKLVLQVGTTMIDNVLEFKVGDKVEVGWSIYAREWKEKWFNNVDLINIKRQDAPAHSAAPNTAPRTKRFEPGELNSEAHKDDLPF